MISEAHVLPSHRPDPELRLTSQNAHCTEAYPEGRLASSSRSEVDTIYAAVVAQGWGSCRMAMEAPPQAHGPRQKGGVAEWSKTPSPAFPQHGLRGAHLFPRNPPSPRSPPSPQSPQHLGAPLVPASCVDGLMAPGAGLRFYPESRRPIRGNCGGGQARVSSGKRKAGVTVL